MKKLILSLFIFCGLVTFGFSQSQHARCGMFFGGEYVKGPFYEGGAVDFSIVAGSGFIFGGFDFNIADGFVDTKYATDTSWNSIMLMGADLLSGVSVKIGPIKPYISAGLGLYIADDFDKVSESSSSSSSSYGSGGGSNSEPAVVGFQAEAMAGVDFTFLEVFGIGAVYKIKYMYGGGFSDTLGITLGIVF